MSILVRDIHRRYTAATAAPTPPCPTTTAGTGCGRRPLRGPVVTRKHPASGRCGWCPRSLATESPRTSTTPSREARCRRASHFWWSFGTSWRSPFGRNHDVLRRAGSADAAAIDKYRGGDNGKVRAALAVVGLSADRAAKEAQIRDDMIRVARRSGASLRQLAEVSGLDRKTVTAIVAEGVRASDLTVPELRSVAGPVAPPKRRQRARGGVTRRP